MIAKKSNKRTIVDICIGIFAHNENKPLYVKKIFGAMRQRQWQTNSKAPTQTISAKLLNDARFQKVGPNIFKLNDAYYKGRKTFMSI